MKDEGGLAACGEMPVPEIERRERVSTALDQRGAIEPKRQREIVHIDMDAFYASVEQRDHPELRGKPVAVGGSCERGVVAAASYEARAFGVHGDPPSVTAKRKCPEPIFVSPRFDVYRAVSHQIREIFAEYTPLVEPLSLDEAYLDVTENLKDIASATEIAEQIRAKNPRRDRAHGVRGRLLQQIPGQDGFRRAQARRAVRHHAQDGGGLRRSPNRSGDAGCDGRLIERLDRHGQRISVTVQSPIRHQLCVKWANNRQGPCNFRPPVYRRLT